MWQSGQAHEDRERAEQARAPRETLLETLPPLLEQVDIQTDKKFTRWKTVFERRVLTRLFDRGILLVGALAGPGHARQLRSRAALDRGLEEPHRGPESVRPGHDPHLPDGGPGGYPEGARRSRKILTATPQWLAKPSDFPGITSRRDNG
jgi:hypothetical protein